MLLFFSRGVFQSACYVGTISIRARLGQFPIYGPVGCYRKCWMLVRFGYSRTLQEIVGVVDIVKALDDLTPSKLAHPGVYLL